MENKQFYPKALKTRTEKWNIFPKIGHGNIFLNPWQMWTPVYIKRPSLPYPAV